MVSGYFIGEIFMFNLKTSIAAVPANTMQALFGVVTALAIFAGVKKALKK